MSTPNMSQWNIKYLKIKTFNIVLMRFKVDISLYGQEAHQKGIIMSGV